MAVSLQQSTRGAAVSTVLGEDVLAFEQMHVSEHLGRLFEIRLVVASDDDTILGKQLLGTNVTIRADVQRETPRMFNGLVCEFSRLGASTRLIHYELVLRPWLWFLTRTSDCKIFQEMDVPDIIKEVFRELGFTDFDDRLQGTYREWEYCVQYQETAFNFVSRLMEQEGIYYFFTHKNGSHTLVLADDFTSHEAAPSYATVPFLPSGNSNTRSTDHLYSWVGSERIQPEQVELNSFDFTDPKHSLIAKSVHKPEYENLGLGIYDYSKDYTTLSDGEKYASVRLQEHQAAYEILQGEGNVGGLYAGSLFNMVENPHNDLNVEYLVTGADYTLERNFFEAGTAESDEGYVCQIEAIRTKKSSAYRSPRTTPKPEICGPQTAIVTGKAGEEIWTDSHGRVKVQFHWDRHGDADDTSSCWVRVARASAGKQWGAVFTPRVGQEVIVEYLNGDPDQPLITGSLYNGDNTVPYKLPDNATISTTKSNSSKGGDGFNEIRFEDKKGEEQLFVHAQKNQDIRVLNDRFETVEVNRHLIVGGDKMEEILETDGKKGSRHETVAGHHKEQIGQDRYLKILGKQAQEIDESLSLNVKKDVGYKFEANHSQEITGDSFVKAKNIVIEAETNITLMVGKSYIAISAAGIKLSTEGDIVLEAQKNISGEAGINIDLAAGAQATVDGSAMAKLTSSGIVQVQGSLVKIN